MVRCRITVLKKMINKELVDEYSNLDLTEMCLGCYLFAVGEEFIVEEDNKVPEGFCSYAWTDILKDVNAIMYGANYPWMKQPGVAISCCSDGLMPVIFKIEKINS